MNMVAVIVALISLLTLNPTDNAAINSFNGNIGGSRSFNGNANDDCLTCRDHWTTKRTTAISPRGPPGSVLSQIPVDSGIPVPQISVSGVMVGYVRPQTSGSREPGRVVPQIPAGGPVFRYVLPRSSESVEMLGQVIPRTSESGRVSEYARPQTSGSGRVSGYARPQTSGGGRVSGYVRPQTSGSGGMPGPTGPLISGGGGAVSYINLESSESGETPGSLSSQTQRPSYYNPCTRNLLKCSFIGGDGFGSPKNKNADDIQTMRRRSE